uniref:Uncharacterized protein n=1 Tax=Arundo donax TaxID=35708 RepID=A0A0A9EJN8_ARUDO
MYKKGNLSGEQTREFQYIYLRDGFLCSSQLIVSARRKQILTSCSSSREASRHPFPPMCICQSSMREAS